MARTFRNAKIDTRSARTKLVIRREPYWTLIVKGRALGYRKGTKGGRWIARYRDDDGHQHYRALGPADDHLDADDLILSFGPAQEKARAWFAEKARSLDGASAGPYTVHDAVTDYLAEYEARGGKDVNTSRTRANAQILPKLGDVDATKLTTAKLKAWHRDLANEPPRVRTSPGDEQKYRDTGDDPEAERRRKATANRVLTILKAALNHAWREGKVASDAAWRRVSPFQGVDVARTRYLSADEVTRLVNACDEPFRAIVQAALYTGARYGELTRLEVADFNPDAGTLAIRSSKSGKPRHVFLTDDGRAFLRAITAGWQGDALIFSRANGQAWGKSQQQRPLKEACRRARINPPASFHVLRHTYGSHFAMSGVPLQVIATNLGHSDTRMVEKHYGHLAPSYIANAIRSAGLGYVVPATDSKVAPLRAG